MALLDGRYELGECIGQGGMARVFRAEDHVLGRTVAIKMMRSDADGMAAPARARNEVAVLAALDHPSLVKLLDASVLPDRPHYLVMELVDGATLADELRGGAFTPSEVVHLAQELASALHVVHESGVVHRDVKPSNILLASTYLPGRKHHAKLADFGIACLLDATRVTSPGTMVGTAAYLAPEQVRGEAPAPSADIYSLGLVLLEALTGDRAFGHASGIGAVMARLVETPAIPDWVGPDWAGLLGRMTASDPAQRPTAIEVAQRVGELPTGIERPADAAVARTSPAADPDRARGHEASSVLDPTMPYGPEMFAPVHPAPARVTRRVRGVRKALAVSGAVAAAVLLLQAGIWAEERDSGVPSPLAPLSAVTDESAVDAETAGDGGLETAVVEPATSVPENSGERWDGEKSEQKARQSAEKAAEKAQKAAEESQKRAEKAEKDAADNEDRGPGSR
jgi:tRNA A-37 threonylcarbamoyl transferase component Bud32